MALNRISEILAHMRENTEKITAVARAEMAREAAERAAVSRSRYVISALGGARGGMKKERSVK